MIVELLICDWCARHVCELISDLLQVDFVKKMICCDSVSCTQNITEGCYGFLWLTFAI